MSVVSMKQLLEAGVHFGHPTRKWNPKMKKYIYTARNDIYILDLEMTVGLIDEAYAFMKEVISSGKSALFVGTKKQAKDAVIECRDMKSIYEVPLALEDQHFAEVVLKLLQVKNKKGDIQ